MNRLLLISTALLGGLVPLAVDSALKGAVLLLVAALAALSMRRASAAARHLVWLIAVAALLVVPLLTITLPQWRALPDWAASPVRKAVADTEQASGPLPRAFEPADLPIQREQPVTEPATAPAAAVPSPLPVAGGEPQVVAREASLPTEPAPGVDRAGWLGLGWLLGFLLLSLRLLASQVTLRRAARSCRTPDAVKDQRLLALFDETRGQLGVRLPVKLMIDPKRTIPLVWGVFRPRLMVPAEACGWSDSALRSVLLHELAHLKRRDTAVQWLAQIACALHWWNPLVWLAAWRLHVEREKACDDLVLASGVQPSSYAEHLLHVATRLSPARWSSACGLAMARKSSLEGRLVAVLSERPNRRSVTRTLVATALLLGTGIAIPVAMLRAADEAWTSPSGAHIGGKDFSAFCVHEGKETAFVIAYHGFTGSSSALDSNPATRTWTNAGTLTAKKAGIELSFHRSHTAPGKITLTTAPSGPRDLGQPAPAPAPRGFGQKEYNLAKGRVFLLTDSGLVRQFDLATPVVTDQDSLKELAALIAAIPPQEREDIAPNHKDARALYEIWKRHARANGDIPGALIGELAAAVKIFITYNPTWETVPKLNKILPRLDASHDWTPADAIALLDEVAAVQDSPLQAAAEKLTAAIIRKGKTLPEEFAGVAWGETQPNGLRAAWVLEPAAAEHRMGTALKARLLVQNAGNISVVARVPTWHQGGVSARDAAGSEVEVSGIEWTTLARLVPVRLAPGECIEINAPGVGLGNDAGRGPWAGPRVGSNVLAQDGVELTLTHGPISLDGSGVGMREDAPHLVGPGWWQAHIKARLSRDLPLPAGAAERTHLLNRAVRELFGTAPTAEETAAFAADTTARAFDALVQRLAARADVAEFSASLPLAPAKFRVLPADPASDKTPRVVLGPGEYPLSETATLKIVGRPDGERSINDTEIISEPSVELGIPVPEKIEIPDGWGTWAIVCRPGEGFFYVLHKGGARKIGYTNPRQITDTPATDLPAGFRDEVKRQFDIAGVPAGKQSEVIEKSGIPDATPAESQELDERKEQGAIGDDAPAAGLVFITSEGPLPAKPFDTGDEVTLEIKRIPLPPGEKRAIAPPGGKPATTSGVYAILRWPARDGQPALEHGEQIVSDTVESPGKWAAAWQPGTKTVWLAAKDPAQSRPGFMEMTFPDSKRITVKHISVKLKDSLLPPSMPAGVRAKFGPFFDIAVPSGTGRPEYYESQQVHVAVQEDKKLHPGAALGGERLTDTGSAEWSVKFELGDTGKPVTEVLARLTIMDADGSKRQALLRTWKAGEPFHINFGADGVLRVVLTGTQYGSIVVEDETPGDGGGPVSYFGNVPDSVNAGVKHTKLEEPLVVKVSAGGKTAKQLEPVNVEVAKDGSMRINGKACTLDELKAAAAGETANPFVVRAHKDAPYAKVLEVVEALKNVGVKEVTFAAAVPAGKLTPESLLGTWRGTVNGERLMLSFHRPPAEKDVQLDIYFGEATIGALADFTLAADGRSAEVVQPSSGGGMKFGTLIPVEEGKLKLELFGRQKGQQETILTLDAETAATEPRQKEARELFELWKATANPDGTIPGTFIGSLATEVRAYVKANPTLDSAAKLPKLLPRFVTSRDWTQAEAIQLLDDVAYHATEPITARVAKAKLPSGPMWRTMVEFQDIPVQIAKWSEAKDGLRIGLRVVDGQWSAGGSVRVELWLHNAGGKDVSFLTAGPKRMDVTVMFSAIDEERNEHRPEINLSSLIASVEDCTLPSGHVAMVKEFDVTFADADFDVSTRMGNWFRDLKPGNYQLRCKWFGATLEAAKSDKQVELTAPDFPFTLGGAAAADEAKPSPIPEPPKNAAAPVPDAVQDGPRAELRPERAQLSNDKYSAVAFQSEKDVNFVLIYEGALSTGLGETWSDTTKRWSIEGHVHLVDPGKTQAAGRNVDKRKVAVKYTSDEPKKLYLDGKGYDLAAPLQSVGAGWLQMSGRVFILRDEGEPIQTGRTLALRDQKDLVTLGDFAAHDRLMAETYADNRRVLAMEGWALAWDTQEPIQHGSGERVAQTRIFPDGRVLSLTNGRELKEFKIAPAELAELTRWLVEEQRIGEWKPARVKIANTGQEIEISPVKNMWDRQTDILIFTRDGKRHGVAAEHGAAGAVDFAPIRERLWALAKKAGDAKPAGGE